VSHDAYLLTMLAGLIAAVAGGAWLLVMLFVPRVFSDWIAPRLLDGIRSAPGGLRLYKLAPNEPDEKTERRVLVLYRTMFIGVGLFVIIFGTVRLLTR
jgi:hypothetical protein